MVFRAICLILALAAGPLSAPPCCSDEPDCCSDEKGSAACPVLPDGECVLAASGPTPAALGRGLDLPPPPQPAITLACLEPAAPRPGEPAVRATASSRPPPFLLTHALRN
jgi:hypothetical protein